ncbi:tRNA-dependent cyclodipeptide synthase [Nocardia africana]|uniref:Cyclodipeptide synthase n=1 Tax=Nocardia africana TaxID=134964 RepID=A0A379X4G7_9NOCA|nr:tRNA-dependent cyclodipeptide synthase [Nocardia africana]MCC3318408.1 tRNA-dependent cyclodipeptide synthase [Nocardia africana]SUH71838.1 Uncharacterised protein [Nocardia africana]
MTVESAEDHATTTRTVASAAFTAEALTGRCRALADAGDHACIGISPFNSYFTTDRITALARWARPRFASVHFYVPDGPSAYTLQALGYTPQQAAHKARRQGRWLGNKIRRALTDIGVPDPEPLVLDSAALRTNTAYHRLHTEVSGQFTRDPDFAAACLSASGWVLGQRLPDTAAPTDAQTHAAVRYLLAELPLFTDTAAIVGTTASVFCYHQPPAFLHALYHHRLAWKPAPHQGFLVLAPTGERADPTTRPDHPNR